MRCIACGCTEERACPGGCSWVSISPPKCSACDDEECGLEDIEAVDHPEPRGTFFSDELCPASPTPAVHVPLYVDENSGYCARCRIGFAA